MIIKKADTNIEHFAKGKIFDYPLPDGKIGISYQEHNGRVPNKGWGVNKVCYEIYFIVDGKASIFIDNEKAIIEKGDIVIIYPNQKSYIITNNLKLVTITSPNWYKKQYEEV